MYHISHTRDALLPGANALQASIDAISKYGGARVGYRTMLDALIPASEILREVGIYVYIGSIMLISISIYPRSLSY